MRIERWADLTCRIVEPAGTGPGDPVVVLMHGFGAEGTDLVPLHQSPPMPSGVRFVFPEAPERLPRELGGMGRQWWPLDMMRLQQAMMSGQPRNYENEDPPGIDARRAQISAMLDEMMAALEVDPERVVVGGFSQGSMLACDVVFGGERDYAGLVVLSGAHLRGHVWDARMVARAATPVFQSHGVVDAVLGLAGARRLEGAMQAAGLNVDFVEFRGGHEIPPPAYAGLVAFISRVTAG